MLASRYRCNLFLLRTRNSFRIASGHNWLVDAQHSHCARPLQIQQRCLSLSQTQHSDALIRILIDAKQQLTRFASQYLMAEHLGMPSLTQVIKMDISEGGLRCERQAEYGYDTVQIEMPAVISVGDAINEPRYPSLKAIMGAKKKPLEAMAVADAGIDAGKVGGDNSAAHWIAAKAPPAKASGEIIEDEDTGETVEKILAWLDERKLI